MRIDANNQLRARELDVVETADLAAVEACFTTAQQLLDLPVCPEEKSVRAVGEIGDERGVSGSVQGRIIDPIVIDARGAGLLHDGDALRLDRRTGIETPQRRVVNVGHGQELAVGVHGVRTGTARIEPAKVFTENAQDAIGVRIGDQAGNTIADLEQGSPAAGLSAEDSALSIRARGHAAQGIDGVAAHGTAGRQHRLQGSLRDSCQSVTGEAHQWSRGRAALRQVVPYQATCHRSGKVLARSNSGAGAVPEASL